MRTPRQSEPTARLLQPPEPARFSTAELEGLPEPVQRHLAQAITPRAPLATSARLRMRGHIEVGRWPPFRARQILNPHSASSGPPGPPTGPAPRPSGCPPPCSPASGLPGRPGPEDQVTASFRVGDTPVEPRLRLDAAGRIASLIFDRWGDPDNRGAFAQHRFGGEVTGYRSFQGLTIPSQGRLGWFYGQDRWPAGEFFRYQITDLEPVTGPGPHPGR